MRRGYQHTLRYNIVDVIYITRSLNELLISHFSLYGEYNVDGNKLMLNKALY